MFKLLEVSCESSAQELILVFVCPIPLSILGFLKQSSTLKTFTDIRKSSEFYCSDIFIFRTTCGGIFFAEDKTQIEFTAS